MREREREGEKDIYLYIHIHDVYIKTQRKRKRNLLGTPETSLRGLRTLNVRSVERSTDPSPSWLAGIMYGRNL